MLQDKKIFRIFSLFFLRKKMANAINASALAEKHKKR